MKLTYEQFNKELERLADEIMELTQNVEVAEDVPSEDVEMLRSNARMHVLNLVESLEDEFGSVLDD